MALWGLGVQSRAAAGPWKDPSRGLCAGDPLRCSGHCLSSLLPMSYLPDLVPSPWPVVYNSPSGSLVWAPGLIFPWLTGKHSWWGAFKA